MMFAKSVNYQLSHNDMTTSHIPGSNLWYTGNTNICQKTVFVNDYLQILIIKI